MGLDGKPIIKTEIKKVVILVLRIFNQECQDEDEVKNEIVSDDEDNNEEEKKPLAGTLSSIAKDGWVHKAPRTARNPYDPAARNPLFIDCSQLVDSELLLLAKHYHPSVAVFAQQMLEVGSVVLESRDGAPEICMRPSKYMFSGQDAQLSW